MADQYIRGVHEQCSEDSTIYASMKFGKLPICENGGNDDVCRETSNFEFLKWWKATRMGPFKKWKTHGMGDLSGEVLGECLWNGER